MTRNPAAVLHRITDWVLYVDRIDLASIAVADALDRNPNSDVFHGNSPESARLFLCGNRIDIERGKLLD
jgi:hypothetical protein